MTKPCSVPTFNQAGALWLHQHKRYIRPNTIGCYEDALKPLGRFFGELRLDKIEIPHIRAYQDHRSAQVTPQTTNREVGVFQLVMKEFDQWARLQSRYKPLKVEPHRSGHSLTAEEEERLKTVAFSKKKWRLAAHCIVVMMNTTMGFGELRQLRRRDVDMIPDQHKMGVNADVIEPNESIRAQPLPEPTNPSIQAEIERLKAEIARLADRQSDLALREHSPASSAPEKPTHSRRRRKSESGHPGEAIFHLRRSAKNLIAFPNRSA